MTPEEKTIFLNCLRMGVGVGRSCIMVSISGAAINQELSDSKFANDARNAVILGVADIIQKNQKTDVKPLSLKRFITSVNLYGCRSVVDELRDEAILDMCYEFGDLAEVAHVLGIEYKEMVSHIRADIRLMHKVEELTNKF